MVHEATGAKAVPSHRTKRRWSTFCNVVGRCKKVSGFDARSPPTASEMFTRIAQSHPNVNICLDQIKSMDPKQDVTTQLNLYMDAWHAKVRTSKMS